MSRHIQIIMQFLYGGGGENRTPVLSVFQSTSTTNSLNFTTYTDTDTNSVEELRYYNRNDHARCYHNYHADSEQAHTL